MLVVSHLVKFNAGLMNFHFIERPRCQNHDRPFAHICSHFMKIKLLNVGKMFPDIDGGGRGRTNPVVAKAGKEGGDVPGVRQG